MSFEALLVYECTCTKLQDKTIVKHIFKGRDKFTSEEAIKILAKRGLNITHNTVFETTRFKLRRIKDPPNLRDLQKSYLIISRFRVQAFQCIKNKNGIEMKLMIWENFMPSLQAMDITLKDYFTRA